MSNRDTFFKSIKKWFIPSKTHEFLMFATKEQFENSYFCGTPLSYKEVLEYLLPFEKEKFKNFCKK